MFSKINLVTLTAESDLKFAKIWLVSTPEVPAEVEALAKECGFKNKPGEIKTHFTNQMVNIVANVDGFDASKSHHKKLKVFGNILRAAAKNDLNSVTFVNAQAEAEMIACAAGVLGWNSGIYQSEFSKKELEPELNIGFREAEISAANTGLALAESMNFARTLGHTPPNIATPFWIGDEAKRMADKFGMKCEIIKGSELEKAGCVGLITVGQASENKPCMIRIVYSPNGELVDEKPLVLVGKTVCYDTGGLSLKINNGMVGMKQDKDGGCAVIGAMQAIASAIKPNRKVVALLCAAENSISNNAYRPDDVMIYPNGISVEVTNTDAEGRLVLADGLIWASTKENPSAVIDMATLTGGVVTALGKVFAGAFSNSDELYQTVEGSAHSTGERIWRLPLDPEYSKLMKSEIADLVNSNPNRQAHPIQGASFLEAFVPKDLPWVHLDIAGVHHIKGSDGAFNDGPAAFGVLLVSHFAGKH